MCKYEGCKKRSVFNKESETKPLYCGTHKLKDMINITSPTCIHEGCRIQPMFNKEGEPTGLYCASHKLEGMIDVKNKKCIYEGCKLRSNFNKEGETTPLYCASHKLDDMIDVKNKKCIYKGCKICPSFNKEGETKALYCTQHKTYNMVDVVNKLCKSKWCFVHVEEKYGYCLYCFKNLFPDKLISRNYKTKEYAVVEYVKQSFQDYTWITDKKIYDGCSKRRPDLWLDLGYQILIVEVDENQHINYDITCENKRIMELSKDVGHRPIVFYKIQSR